MEKDLKSSVKQTKYTTDHGKTTYSTISKRLYSREQTKLDWLIGIRNNQTGKN